MLRKFLHQTAVLSAAATVLVCSALPAQATDDLRFWDGTLAGDDCGARTRLGSLNIDNPFESGISYLGQQEKYKRTCSYPTSTNQTCWYTLVSRSDAGLVKAGISWVSAAGNTYSLSDSGYGDVSSPVICDHQVDGSSWWGWVEIGGVRVTLYT